MRVCATIGGSPHVILGQEMLTPRDRGGLTGGKRLIKNVHKKLGHFADLIVADAVRELYLYQRIHGYKESRVTRKSVTRIFRDDLLLENYCGLLYEESG